MKRNRRWMLLLLSMVLIFSMVLGACGQKESGTTADPDGDDEQDGQVGVQNENVLAEEQIFRFPISSNPLLDPQRLQYNFEFDIVNNVMEGLLRLDENDQPEPAMAERWESSEDGMEWTFYLRDAVWSDGSPVTADDFVYAWERAVDPDVGSIYADIVGDYIKQVEAPDEKLLKVELLNPTPYFESLMTFGTYLPAKKEFVESVGEGYGTAADKLLYNGPFKLVEWDQNNRLVLQKNENYWAADRVTLQEVDIEIVQDSNTELAMYEDGLLDRITLARENVPAFVDHPEFSTDFDYASFYMVINTENEVLNNVNIRKALSYGFERQNYCDVVLNNGSIPAYGLLPPDLPGPAGSDFRSANGDLVATDLEQAQKYLEQGLQELGLEKLPKLIFISNDTTAAIKTGEFTKENYGKLGIEIEVKNYPVAALKEMRQKGEFDLFFGGWGPDYWDPLTFLDLWVTTGPFNEGKWSNTQYDEIIRFAQTTFDTEERMNRLLEGERILIADEAGIVPVYYRKNARLTKANVLDYVTHPFGAENDWRFVKIATE